MIEKNQKKLSERKDLKNAQQSFKDKTMKSFDLPGIKKSVDFFLQIILRFQLRIFLDLSSTHLRKFSFFHFETNFYFNVQLWNVSSHSLPRNDFIFCFENFFHANICSKIKTFLALLCEMSTYFFFSLQVAFKIFDILFFNITDFYLHESRENSLNILKKDIEDLFFCFMIFRFFSNTFEP